MPTVFRLIDVRRQFVTAAGVPLSGGKLNFYTAGTSTRKDTYADAGGTTANSNPVVLNSQGFPDVGIYGTTGAYKIVLTDSADAVIWTEDSVTPINDVSNAAQTEWTDHNGTPTYISATSFSVTGDHTATFHVGRRVRTTNSGGTKVYSYVATVSHSAGVTTVTLTNDSGSLDSGLSAVSYGLLDSTNHSLPKATFSADVLTADQITYTTGSITAAATTDLTTVDASIVTVNHTTGTVAITAFGSVPSGQLRYVRFNVTGGTLTITHNATSLIIPGGANVTVADKDRVLVEGLGSGNVRLWDYTRGDGTPLIPPDRLRSNGTDRLIADSNGALQAGGASAQTGYTGAGAVTLPAGAGIFAHNAAKAWASVALGASPTLNDSINVTSVTQVVSGTYEVTMTNAMPNTNYAVLFGRRVAAPSASAPILIELAAFTRTTTKFRFYSASFNGASVNSDDTGEVYFGVFAD